MAVSAFYSDRHGPVKNVKGQCNWHDHHLPSMGGVANRLPFCAAPGAEEMAPVTEYAEKWKKSRGQLTNGLLWAILSIERALRQAVSPG